MGTTQTLGDVDRHVSGRDGLLDALGIRSGELVEADSQGAITHIRVLVNDIDHTVTAANLAAGQQILSFEKGAIQPLGARVEYDIVNAGAAAASAGEVGIGTVVATGAVATLATGTFEDFMEGQAVAALVAATSQEDNVEVDGLRTTLIDGVGTAVDLFFNFAFAGTAGGDITFTNIVVDLWFIWIPQAPKRS